MSHALTSRKRHVNAAQSIDVGVLYSTISAGMILARRYLTGRGIDQDFADRYGSAFGRTTAKAYRTAHGAEPRKAWSLVSGKWRRVNGYLPADVDVLDEAFDTYPRTRDYVVAQFVAGRTQVEECRIPDCSGEDHLDNTCVARLPEVAFDADADVVLAAEFLSENGGAPHIVPFVFNMTSLETRRDLRDQATARSFVDQLRALADAIDKAAVHLPA
ncbi:hypothetical protein [Streptomyces sp. NPDC052225]|uniref:hypothetical protein n=1 Tax=Streptomyces sp. NPDC052225 TaxID=3154949 RepID=UPI003430336D